MKKLLITTLILIFPLTLRAANFDIKVDTGGVNINAIEGRIKIPQPIEKISTGNSAVLIWITNPTVENGEIVFSGITPGGFNGDLTLLTITSDDSIKDEFKFENVTALSSDGKATEVPVKLHVVSADIKTDHVPPQPFKIEIGMSEDLFGGREFATFLAQDKESGMDHYESAEIFLGNPRDSDWSIASMPYEIRNKWGIKKLYIKAVDREGNERIQQVAMQNRKLLWLIVAIIILISCALFVRRS